jgi:hypothetical protein
MLSRGQYKITRKDRPHGRKVLDNIILPLVKKGCIIDFKKA